MKKPSVDRVLELVEGYESYWKKLHSKQEEWQRYFKLENKIALPKGLGAEQFTPKMAYDLVKVGVNNFMMDNPTVTVPPRNEESDDDALIASAFGNAFLEKNTPKIRDNGTMQLTCGQLVYKVGVHEAFLGNDWKKLESDKKGELKDLALTSFPIWVQTPHPTTVFASPDFESDYVPHDAAEKVKMTVSSAKGMCERNNWKTTWAKDKKPTEEVECVFWYSPEWRCVTIDKKPVLKGSVVPNVLKFVPYIIGPAGMGILTGKPEDYYQGIIAANTGTIDLLTNIMTQLVAINKRFAWPKLIGMLRDGGNTEAVKKEVGEEFNLSPESVDFLPSDVDELKYLESQGSAQALLVQELGMVLGTTSQPIGMGGGSMSGVYSGTHANTRIAYEKTWYKDPFKIHEDVLAVVVGRAFQILDTVIRHPISVRPTGGPSKTVAPSNIKKGYYCKVKLLADSPEAADIKKHLGSLAFGGGLYDHQSTLTEFYDLSDDEAEKIVDRRRIDEIEKSPLIQQLLAMQYYAKKGQDDMVAAIKNGEWQQSRGGSRVHPGAKSEPASKTAPQQERPMGMEQGPNPSEVQAGQL